jgi:hypothetical protein
MNAVMTDLDFHSAADFHVTLADKKKLFNSGRAAGKKLLGNKTGPDGSRATTRPWRERPDLTAVIAS